MLARLARARSDEFKELAEQLERQAFLTRVQLRLNNCLQEMRGHPCFSDEALSAQHPCPFVSFAASTPNLLNAIKPPGGADVNSR